MESKVTQLSAEEVWLLNAYWRAANYLSVGQIYLYDNPLLREPLKLEHVNLRVLMERVCEYYVRAAQPKRLTITCRAIGPVPMAWGDRVGIAVIADNLLSNAVQASPPHGSIDVQVMTEPGYVICSVRDTGPDLTHEEQERLLRVAVPAGVIARDPQSGFGLAIATEFVRRMDGDLWCESEPGHGARFSFRLPAIE